MQRVEAGAQRAVEEARQCGDRRALTRRNAIRRLAEVGEIEHHDVASARRVKKSNLLHQLRCRGYQVPRDLCRRYHAGCREPELEGDVVRSCPHRIERIGIHGSLLQEILHLRRNGLCHVRRGKRRHARKLRYARATFGVVVAALVRRSRGESVTLSKHFCPDRSRIGREFPGAGRQYGLEGTGIRQTVAKEIETAELRRGFAVADAKADE